MTNAEMATNLVINYLESEGIYVGTPETIAIVNKWEAKLDPIDFISLAAVAIADPNEIALSIPEIRKIRDFYFPSKIYFKGVFNG